MLQKAKKWAKYIGVTFLTWFAIHTLFICVDGLRDEKHESSVAVVLGNKVNADGTLSPRLKARLDKGAELFQTGYVGYILVSGGLGKEGFYEGDKMREYLLTKGIPDTSIIVDNKGDNTLATVKNTIAICKQRNLPFVTVVSQYYHIARIKTMFKHEGGMAVDGVAADYFELRDGYSIVREFFAYYTYLL